MSLSSSFFLSSPSRASTSLLSTSDLTSSPKLTSFHSTIASLSDSLSEIHVTIEHIIRVKLASYSRDKLRKLLKEMRDAKKRRNASGRDLFSTWNSGVSISSPLTMSYFGGKSNRSRNIITEIDEALRYYVHMQRESFIKYQDTPSHRLAVHDLLLDKMRELLGVCEAWYDCLDLDDVFGWYAEIDAREVREESGDASVVEEELTLDTSLPDSFLSSLIAPNSFHFYTSLTTYLTAQLRFHKVLELYSIIRTQYPPEKYLMTDIFLQQLTLFEKWSDHVRECRDLSIMLLEESLREHPIYKSRDFRMRLARLYVKAKRFDDAVQVWQYIREWYDCDKAQRIELVSEIVRVRLLETRTAQRFHEKMQEAADLLHNLLDQDLRFSPRHREEKIQANILLARVLWNMEQEDESLELLHEALEHTREMPASPTTRVALQIEIHKYLMVFYSAMMSVDSRKRAKEYEKELKRLHALQEHQRQQQLEGHQPSNEVIVERLASSVYEFAHRERDADEREDLEATMRRDDDGDKLNTSTASATLSRSTMLSPASALKLNRLRGSPRRR